jgi:bisphosphoglycerate-dependent phosphoglycerate mutase
MKFKIEGEQLTFSELVDEAIEEIGKGKAQGEQTKLRRVYDVKIPSKVKNRKGKEVSNNYEKFSLKVEEYVTENLKSVKAEVKPVGSGRVVVIFRPL